MAQQATASFAVDDVRLYLLWEPVWEGEVEPRAKSAALELAPTLDERWTQLWTPTLEIGMAFVKPLGWGTGEQTHAGGDVPWDFYAAYPPGVRWEEGQDPPRPSLWTSPIVRDEKLEEHLRELVPE